MSPYNKVLLSVIALIASFDIFSQETFLLNYQDVDIAKVTQDISNFQKKL